MTYVTGLTSLGLLSFEIQLLSSTEILYDNLNIKHTVSET
jgi:hypothetical protein